MFVFYATGAIVGNAIAPSPSLATLPITLFVPGDGGLHSAFRRAGANAGPQAAFRLGTGAGMVTGLAAAPAVVLNSFLLFCLAAMLGGRLLPWRSVFVLPPPTASPRRVAPVRCRW